MRRARETTTSPSSVSAPVERSTSVAPSSDSSRATWVDTLDWTVCRRRAAAENDPASATAVRAVSWRRSIACNDGTYRKQLFDELLADRQTCPQQERAARRIPPPKAASPNSVPQQDPPPTLCSTCRSRPTTRGRLLLFPGLEGAFGALARDLQRLVGARCRARWGDGRARGWLPSGCLGARAGVRGLLVHSWGSTGYRSGRDRRGVLRSGPDVAERGQRTRAQRGVARRRGDRRAVDAR